MFNFTNLTYRGAAALALTLILHTTQASAAETCVAAPTCAELGYTLTSTANCVGTPLKCPFDTTKYNCTQKSEVIYNASLNWAGKTKINFNVTTTPPKNGCIFGNARDTGKGEVYYTIAGAKFTVTKLGDQGSYISFCLTASDSYYVKGYNYSDDVLYFVPYKGS